MKNKIKDYIDLIFADAPDCAKTREIKEEMYANVSDRYDDLIKEGKSEAAAYNISISGIGDISELVDSVKTEQAERHTNPDNEEMYTNPYGNSGEKSKRSFTEKEQAEIEKYRMRRGIMNAIAIALYIICWVPLVAMTSVAESVGGNEDVAAAIGICIMMIMVAVATVLMVLKSSIKPISLKGVKDSELEGDYDDDDDGEKPKNGKKSKNPILSALSTVIWALTICVYLGISFHTGAWHITWLMFLIATAVDNIIEAIFELCGKKYI